VPRCDQKPSAGRSRSGAPRGEGTLVAAELSGIPWPCNEDAPDGTDRLYADGVFLTATEDCETFGYDLLTGGVYSEQEHRAMEMNGRAFLNGCPYVPASEPPDDDYPFPYTTGRTVYQFQTRTKTARARQLQDAAPDAWVELSRTDAERLGVGEGDVVRVESRRGAIVVPARVGNVRPRVVFAPFHYGAWDLDALQPADQHRQANELPRTV
jgi:anaerobic selenocysteine-containing dehydrogenase